MSETKSERDEQLARAWRQFTEKHPEAAPPELRAFGLKLLLEESLAEADRQAFLREARLSQQEDKLALDARKFELLRELSLQKQRQKQEEEDDSHLTPEERERRIHELLGM